MRRRATYCDDRSGYILSTVDFTNPDTPRVESELDDPVDRLERGRAVRQRPALSVAASGCYDGSDTTPFQVYDLTNPTTPTLAGTVTIPGTVWNILPGAAAAAVRARQLGRELGERRLGHRCTYLDVTEPRGAGRARHLARSVRAGHGRRRPTRSRRSRWTRPRGSSCCRSPAGTTTQQTYNNGLQLIEFTPTTQTTAGAAHTKGWVERGIFVGNRLVSLSDMSLAVVDYTNPMAPSRSSPSSRSRATSSRAARRSGGSDDRRGVVGLVGQRRHDLGGARAADRERRRDDRRRRRADARCRRRRRAGVHERRARRTS